jgi:hypothetical protein
MNQDRPTDSLIHSQFVPFFHSLQGHAFLLMTFEEKVNISSVDCGKTAIFRSSPPPPPPPAQFIPAGLAQNLFSLAGFSAFK